MNQDKLQETPAAESAGEPNLDAEVQQAEGFQPEAAAASPKRHRRRRWYGIPVGALVLVLAVVGLVSLIKLGIGYTYRSLTDDSTERSYDTLIAAAVMMDPEPFENIAAADSETVLEIAIWQTVFNHVSDFTDFDDSARAILPAEDVAATAVELFGVNCILIPTSIQLENTNVADPTAPENTIEYVETENAYHVPLVSTVSDYQPYTVSVKSHNNLYRLKVAYCVALTGSEQLSENVELIDDNLLVVKYMEYELTYDKELDFLYISAIRSLEEEEASEK